MGRKAATILAFSVVLCSCSLAWAEDEHAIDDGLYGQIEAHLSILSDVADRSILGDTVGYGARIGYRWGDWGIPFQIEHNLWFTEEFERGISTGAINIGTGFEYLYFDKRVRLSLVGGLSILASDTAIDDPGEVGFFLDLRPAGLRWRVNDIFTMQLDPLTFTVVAPALGGIPLVLVEYRTVATVEFDLWEPAGSTPTEPTDTSEALQ